MAAEFVYDLQYPVFPAVKAERGAIRFRNTEKFDVEVYARGLDETPFIAEVKAQANHDVCVTLERWLGQNSRTMRRS